MFNFTPTVAYTSKDSCGSTVLLFMCVGGERGHGSCVCAGKKVAFPYIISKENSKCVMINAVYTNARL